jgi:hypothetical protein
MICNYGLRPRHRSTRHSPRGVISPGIWPPGVVCNRSETVPGVKKEDVVVNRWHIARTAVTALTLAAVALLFAACGAASGPGVASIKGSSSPTTTLGVSGGNSGGPPTAAQLALQEEFVSCMKRHGVPDMPEPLSSGGFDRSALSEAAGIPSSASGSPASPQKLAQNEVGGGARLESLASPQFKAALQACNSVAVDAGFILVPTAAQRQQQLAQKLKFAQCMRTHGVPNYPDPNNQGGITIGGRDGIDPNSPQFQAAQKACQ